MKTNIDAIKEELARAEALLGSLERSVSSASFTSPPVSPCTSFIHTAGRTWSDTSSPTTSSVGSLYKSATSPSNSPTMSPLDKVMTFPHNSDLYEKASTFSASSSTIGTQLSSSSTMLIPSTTSHQAESGGVSSLPQRNAGSGWVQSLPSPTSRLAFLTNTIGSTREGKFAQSGQLFRPQASPMVRTIATTQIQEKEQQPLSTHLYSSCSNNESHTFFLNGNGAESTNRNGSHATSERTSAMTKNTDGHMTSIYSSGKNAQDAGDHAAELKICIFRNKSTQTAQVDLLALTHPSASSSSSSECCQVLQRELDTVRQRNQRLHGLLASQSRKMHDLMEQRNLLEQKVEEKEQQNMVLKLQFQRFKQEVPGQDHLNGDNSNSFMPFRTHSKGNSYPLLRLTGINE
uniref:uncharacterized protein n=1 Tax=Myxine glutinosa TaxID=7769 RepID=UPI00358F0A92